LNIIKIGLNKFFIAGDNSLNNEKISDILKDYIDEGYIEVFDIRGPHFSQAYFFEFSFDKIKAKF